MNERKDIFDRMMEEIKERADKNARKEEEEFGRWFVDLYFRSTDAPFVPDGPKDGRIDLFFSTNDGTEVMHHVVNVKFTKQYNKLAPVAFYSEINNFVKPFVHSKLRNGYLKDAVRPVLRARYQSLFGHYDDGRVQLTFLTNYRRNEPQCETVNEEEVMLFHLEDLIQFVVDNIEGAMPRTPPLVLKGIKPNEFLEPETEDTTVPTVVAFARLKDFTDYMKKDPYDLFFARNVRLDLGSTPPNREIRKTYDKAPREFAFSNNGITMLCEACVPNRDERTLKLVNPRVVNGSQTLHSIRGVRNGSPNARVLIKVIQLPVLKKSEEDFPEEVKKRKEIIAKIAMRTNHNNKIVPWDLVANDDFQQELARYFRTKGLFYERRRKEWNVRADELKAVGVFRGPEIKEMAQLIASFNWNNKLLGPARAYSKAAELFVGKPYEALTKTNAVLAYQLHFLDKIILDCRKRVAKESKKLGALKKKPRFALFSMLTRTLQSLDFPWKSTEASSYLESLCRHSRPWDRLIRILMQRIRSEYEAAVERYLREQDVELSVGNFFKSQEDVMKMLHAPVPATAKREAKKRWQNRMVLKLALFTT